MKRGSEAILQVARQGDAKEVRQLLEAGADPNATDTNRSTPLHHAVQGEHYETAALLLAHGSSHAYRNGGGHSALSAKYVDERGLHRLRQHYIRTPDPDDVGRRAAGVREDSTLKALQKDGFARMDSFLTGGTVKGLKRDFLRFVEALDEKLRRGTGRMKNYDEEDHFWVGEKAYVSNNAFKYSATLLELACSQCLYGLAEAYFGKPAHIQRAMAYRYLPEGVGGGMFRPHHDMQDKLLKVMILLTEVGDRDQYMVYHAGTHHSFRAYENFFSNEVDVESEPGTGIEYAKGHPGDVILFNANGAHYANRTEGAPLRDVYILEYSADPAEITGGTLPRDVPDYTSRGSRHPLSLMSRTVPRWSLPFVRRKTSWLETLPFPGLWLARSPRIDDACP